MNVSTGSRLLEQRKELLRRLGEKGLRMSLDELLKLMVPIENVFTIADHTRCILLMLADGIVPSNVKAGYLARLVIRKTLRIMDEMGMDAPLADVVLKHLATTKGILELGESEEVLRTMLDLEVRRYRETTEKGGRMVRRIAREMGAGNTIPVDKLIELYDAHGIAPTQVQAVAAAEGMTVEVPDDFTSLVASISAGDFTVSEANGIEINSVLVSGGSATLNATLGDSPCRLGFKLGTNFINNNHLGHVIFYRFNHHRVLQSRSGYLHSSGVSNSRVRYITIAGDFI
jgi:alanyl-tRNA synthetase